MTECLHGAENQSGKMGGTRNFTPCPVVLAVAIWISVGCCTDFAADLPSSVPATAAKQTMAPKSTGTQSGNRGPDSEEHRIQRYDTLKISVYQQPDLTLTTQVSAQGDIQYPLLGTVELAGLTLVEAAKKISALLDKDYLVNPNVTISVEAYKARKTVLLLGQVRSPGSYEIPEDGSLTVLQAIGKAGGFTPTAAGNRITVVRSENGKEQILRVNVLAIMQNGDKSKDIELKPGDIVSVPETFF